MDISGGLLFRLSNVGEHYSGLPVERRSSRGNCTFQLFRQPGGFVSPFRVSAVKDATHSTQVAVVLFAAAMLVEAVDTYFVPSRIVDGRPFEHSYTEGLSEMKYQAYKRLGVLVPATNTAVEADFQRNPVPGISVHSARLTIADGELSAATLDGMNSVLTNAVRDLAAAHVDVIAYGCTSGSFYKGPGWDENVIKLIREIAGVPAVATSPSVVSALRAAGARKLCVVTPYPTVLNARLRVYLENAGFEVAVIAGDERSAAGGHRAVNDQDPAEIAEFAIRNWAADADALFCSCTAWRAMEAIPEIQAATGKPVITSNQATILASMQLLAPATTA